MIIRIIIMITIIIIIIMRMLRASCAQLEEAKQGSFTYNQGYHLYSLSGAKRLVSIPNGDNFFRWPNQHFFRSLLLLEHLRLHDVLSFRPQFETAKNKCRNVGASQNGLFFASISLYQTYHSDGGNDDPLDNKEFAMENHHVSVRKILSNQMGHGFQFALLNNKRVYPMKWKCSSQKINKKH